MPLIKKKDKEDKEKVAAEKRSGRNCEGNNTYDGVSTNKKPKMEQTKIDSFLKSSMVTVTIDVDTFREGLMEMVCLSTTPLTTFRLQNKGFQKIAGEMAQKLGVSTGHDAVRHLVISTAEYLRADLKELLKEKLCYLKMDAATRGNRNFLAVNVQFYDEKKNTAVIKILDIVDTKGKHDSLYVISLSQKLKAKKGLLDIAQRLEKQNILRRFNKLQPSEEIQLVTVESDRQEENNCTTTTSINSSEDDDFEKELDKKEKRRKIAEIHNSNEEEFERFFNADCEIMECMGRLKVNSVFEAINDYPERIQAACRVASSMPTTQASVERLFSALKLILNDLRQSMKGDLLSAILFYRINNEN